MARNESGKARQKRLKHERHRPEQNAGYDEAVRGAPPTPNMMERVVDQIVPAPPDEQRSLMLREIDERETRKAAADVRRQDRSAG